MAGLNDPVQRPSAATGCYAPMNVCIPTESSLATGQVNFYLRPYRYALSELLGKRNDDTLRTANVAEPVLVLVLSDFTYEISAM